MEITVNTSFPLFGGSNNVCLRTDEGSFPVVISLTTGNAQQVNVLTPFSPHVGYQIDNRDFDQVTRNAKIEREYAQTPNGLVHTEGLRCLHVAIQGIPLARANDFLAFPETSTLSGLVFLMSTPIGQLISRPVISRIQSSIYFHHFFPVDMGNVAAIPSRKVQGVSPMKDFYVFLPEDTSKLSDLKGRFFFLKRKSDELAAAFGIE